MGKGTNTTSTSSAPNPVAAQDYYSLLQQAQGVASTPYQAYSGQLTAPVNQQQRLGIGNINQFATGAQPYLQTAAGYAQNAAQPLTGAQIQQYESPYTQQVVGATQAEFNNQNAQTNQGILGNAAAQGALGGDRVGVAQGIAAGQEQLAQAPVIAGLENQGYNQAVQTAEQQQQNQAAGAYNLSNVGNAIENAGLYGANAQVGAGSLEQQTQQAQDLAAYQQFEQMLQYPFATTGWEAGLETGVGSQLGGTGTTTGPAPNPMNSILGLGAAGFGALGNYFQYGAKRGGRIQGLAGGGAPAAPYGGGTPYGGGESYVPTISIVPGSGAPRPPGLPSNQNPQLTAAQAKGMASGVAFGLSGFSSLGDADPGSAANPLPGLTAEDYGEDAPPLVSVQEAAGGRVPRAYGGSALQSRPGFKRGGVPVRAGMGMASFLPRYRRQGLDTGGVPDDDNVTFSDRFAGLAPEAAPGWNAALSPVNPVAAAYGQQNPYASVEPLPANQNVPGPTAGVGNAVSYGTPPQGNFAPVAAPQAAPDAGVAAPLQVAPTSPQAPPAGVGTASQPAPMDVYQRTIKNMETGSEKNPYAAMVPSVDPKTGATRYAVGAYGIMDSNVPAWTKDALGRAMTPQEFAADPSAQDAVFRAKFGQYAEKYGPEGAARAWLAGEGGMNNPNVKDTFGTDPISYGRQFANNILGASKGGGSDNAPSTMNATPSVNNQTAQIPGIAAAQSQTQPQQRKGLFGLSPDFYTSLMAAGLGMAASRSPFVGEAIGQGGLQGLGTYSSLQQQHIAQGQKQQDLDLKVAELNQRAKQQSDLIAQEARKYNEPTAYEKAQLTNQQAKEQYEQSLPKTVNDPIFGQRTIVQRPDKNWYYTDTGQPVLQDNASGAGPNATAQPGTAPTSQNPTPQTVSAPGQQSPAATPSTDDPSRPFKNAQPSSSTMTQAMQMGLHGQAFLDAVPLPLRNTLESIGNYDEPETVFSKMGRAGIPQDRAIAFVRQFNPEYNSYWAAANRQSVREFLAGGPNSPAAQIRTYNTAIGHAGEVYDALQDLKRANPGILQDAQKAGVPFMSYAAAQLQNRAVQGTPAGAALNRFMTAMTLYGDETNKLYSGSAGAQAEKETIRAPLDPRKSEAEIEAGLQTSAHMMGSRGQALQEQWHTAMEAPGLLQYGTKGEVKDFPVLHDRAKSTLDRIGAGSSAAPVSQPPASRQPGQVYPTPRGPMKWTGTGWVAAQ